MPGSAAKLVITERQQAVLRQIAAAPTSPVRLAQRAEIILRAFEGEENRAIGSAIDLDATAVGLWRRRWVKVWPKLVQIECTETHAAFRRAIEDLLADAPRSGNPGKFTPEQITQILALAPLRPNGMKPWTLSGSARRAKIGKASSRSSSPHFEAVSPSSERGRQPLEPPLGG